MSETPVYRRTLPDGRVVEVWLYSYGKGRVQVGDGGPFLSDEF